VATMCIIFMHINKYHRFPTVRRHSRACMRRDRLLCTIDTPMYVEKVDPEGE
jgi:hypothetical protein